MIRASATASGIAPSASSSTSSTALRHIPRPRRRPGTHVVISKPPMRGFASSNTASSKTPALSRPVLPPLLSRDGTTSRAKSSSSAVLTHPQVKVVSSPLIFESQFSTSASLKKSKKPAVPKRQTIEGDVIYRKEGSKIVRVEDPTEGLDAPVSSLFQAMGALEAPAAAYGQNQDDTMKARKGSDATTADLRTLTLNGK
ncbi:hypothetical protein BGZ99_006816 [Dissophora globulifera]|uniref:Uncharacterized protein n=1 Tax=Dissophora globulifera TaxID=979702 RepID=A0A9P6RDX2_9FUNG|nr:hypothetical protein BGZ99_006816 [Dissophora globulifera]